MPTPPTNPSNPVSSPVTAASKPAAAPGATKARSSAKKATAKPTTVGEGTLVDKSVQKTTRRAAVKSKPKEKSSFEKPAEAEWHRMISEAAYYRAERRGFQAGYEHEDWVWAEEEVRKILSP